MAFQAWTFAWSHVGGVAVVHVAHRWVGLTGPLPKGVGRGEGRSMVPKFNVGYQTRDLTERRAAAHLFIWRLKFSKTDSKIVEMRMRRRWRQGKLVTSDNRKGTHQTA